MEIDQEIFNMMLAKSMHQIARIEFRNSKFPYARGLCPLDPPRGPAPGTPIIGQQFGPPFPAAGSLPECSNIQQIARWMPGGRGTRIIFWRGVRPKVWNPFPYLRIFLPQKTADFKGFFFSEIFANRGPFLRVFLPQKWLILHFFLQFLWNGTLF